MLRECGCVAHPLPLTGIGSRRFREDGIRACFLHIMLDVDQEHALVPDGFRDSHLCGENTLL